MSLSGIEIGAFLNFLNRDGYVLDFSTAGFDTFTHESIGVPLCETYKLSKGRSLIAYVKQASQQDIIKLFNDLMAHYELSPQKENDEQYQKKYADAYVKCRSILDRINTNTIADIESQKLKEVFNSDYISSQIDLMVKMQDKLRQVLTFDRKSPLRFKSIREAYLWAKFNWEWVENCV